jgi:hypothetical protein
VHARRTCSRAPAAVWGAGKRASATYALSVTQRALSVTQRALSVTPRALSVTQRALSVTQRALRVTQRALSVTQRALSVTQRARSVTRRRTLRTAKGRLDVYIAYEPWLRGGSDLVVARQPSRVQVDGRARGVAHRLQPQRVVEMLMRLQQRGVGGGTLGESRESGDQARTQHRGGGAGLCSNLRL